jgi:23S rRNA (cytidine1920-2'-O)/16S rRNA (cytidine1409-2'-O)-methyltransferase
VKKKKIRLDKLLVKRQRAADAAEAKQLIQSGCIRVNGIIRKSPDSQFFEDVRITEVESKQFVSRGGKKLESALKAFAIKPINFTCLDIGSSTGGFTDCLLQNGACKVFCVDVGYGILDWKLRSDSRVNVLERTNARYLTRSEITEQVDLIVIDASFISLNLLLKPLLQFCTYHTSLVALVKPQFQLPRNDVGEKGIVEDRQLQKKAVRIVTSYAESIGFQYINSAASTIKGSKGNQEFFIHLTL